MVYLPKFYKNTTWFLCDISLYIKRKHKLNQKNTKLCHKKSYKKMVPNSFINGLKRGLPLIRFQISWNSANKKITKPLKWWLTHNFWLWKSNSNPRFVLSKSWHRISCWLFFVILLQYDLYLSIKIRFKKQPYIIRTVFCSKI